MQNAEKKTKTVGWTCINPTPYARILHPILHPKSSVNTRHLGPWCRKCRRFSKTFFVEGESETTVRKVQDIGLLWTKVRMFGFKSTDVFIEEVRCFCFPERELHYLNVFVKPYEQRSSLLGYCRGAKEEDEVNCLDYAKSWQRKTKSNEGCLTNAVFKESFRSHGHHVRMHIINGL